MTMSNITMASILFSSILYTYWGIWNTFFQQDEWASLGFVQAQGLWGNIPSISLLELFAGKERILGSLLNNVFHYQFPFEPHAFFFFALIVHGVNGLLVYVIGTKVLHDMRASAIAAIVFALASVPSQSVTWISSHTTVLPSALFALSGIYFYFLYRQRRAWVYFGVSMVLVYVSYLFKETGIFLIAWLPWVHYVLGSNLHQARRTLVQFLPGVVLFSLIFVIRLFHLPGSPAVGVASASAVSPVVHVLVHALWYPLVGFSQVFIAPGILFRAASAFQLLMYDFLRTVPSAPAVVTIVIADMISVLATVGISIVCAALYMRFAPVRRSILLCVAFIVLSFLPFVLLDRASSAYFESRYYYFAAVGAAWLIGICFSSLIRHAQHIRSSGVYALVVMLLWGGLGAYVYKQSTYIRRAVAQLSITSSERVAFLMALNQRKAQIPQKPIFYIEGDSPGYYGIVNLSVPFQQGMGYTLMSWFFETGVVPQSLLSSYYLWNINEQGYTEVGDKGFGYFWDKARLESLLLTRPDIDATQLIGYRYTSSNKTLTDITEELRAHVVTLRK
jgi:hypothetical protein